MPNILVSYITFSFEDDLAANQGDQSNQTLLTDGKYWLEKKHEYVVMKACLSEVRGLREIFINILSFHD